MVENQIRKRGINDVNIINAFLKVPREIFVLPQFVNSAYDDVETPIAVGETLNRSHEDALILAALSIKAGDKILEIGTGTGYLTSLLANLGAKVYTIEIEAEYAKLAAENFKTLGIVDVTLKVGDGFIGWKEHAPFDKIVLNCSPSQVPKPLVSQLAEGGLLILPLGGNQKFQQLILYQKLAGELVAIRKLAPASFTPMKGRALEQ